MRPYSLPDYTSRPHEISYDNQDPILGGGSVDRNIDQQNENYGYLESATLHSEISMSIVTDVTRYQNGLLEIVCANFERIKQSRSLLLAAFANSYESAINKIFVDFWQSMDRRPSLLRRLTQGSLLTREDDTPRTKMCCGLFNVEPVLLLLSISIGFLGTSQPLFTYWARCIEIASTILPDKENATSACAQLAATNGSLQDTVEKDIASMQIWLQMASCIPSLLVSPLIGSWADKYGRKTPMIFAMVGYIFYTAFQVIAVLTYKHITIYRWYFFAELCLGMTGGFSSIMVIALAIVTDDCRHKLKPGSSTVPIRIGVASFMQAFGRLIGNFGFSLLSVAAVTSPQKHADSYVKSAIIQATLSIIAFVYAIFFVKETHFPTRNQDFAYQEFQNANDNEVEIIQPGPERAKFSDYFNSLCEVLTAKREGWTRLCISLSLLFVFVEFLALDASLLLLYVKRPPFSWTDKEFSDFSLVKGILFSIGMVAIPLFLTLVSWLGKDSIMIAIGIFASSASFFLIAQATTTKEIFLTAIFSFFAGGISPGYRSFLPRMVPKEQTARLLTLCSMIISICPIVSAFTFNNLFKATLHAWPGCAFFVGGCVQMVVVLGQILIHRLMLPQWRLQREQKLIQQAEARADHDAEENNGDGIGSISNTSAAGSASPSTSESDHRNLVA